jgi:uncharacterized membrane protein YhaH (DUF805 family)
MLPFLHTSFVSDEWGEVHPQKFSVRNLFVGRLDSANYFFVIIIVILVYFFAKAIDHVTSGSFIDTNPLITILIGAIALPIVISTPVIFIGASIRRYHDIGRTGWSTLLFLIPYFGFLFLFILCLTKSQQSSNKYGPAPDTKKDILKAILNIS